MIDRCSLVLLSVTLQIFITCAFAKTPDRHVGDTDLLHRIFPNDYVQQHPDYTLKVVHSNTTSSPYKIVICLNCQCDICPKLDKCRIFAPVETVIFNYLISTDAPGSRGCANRLVVDVGANVGHFSMFSAAHGCRVMSFEPQAAPRSLLHASVMYNGFGHRVEIFGSGLADKKSVGQMRNDWWGTQGALPGGTQTDMSKVQSITFESLSDLVYQDVYILKVDTEGTEASVFSGAWALLALGRVENVIIEVKGFNNPDKRELLKKIMVTGNMSYAYNYQEHYGLCPHNISLISLRFPSKSLTDASQILLSSNLSHVFPSEDFWLRRYALPIGLRIGSGEEVDL